MNIVLGTLGLLGVSTALFAFIRSQGMCITDLVLFLTFIPSPFSGTSPKDYD